MKDDSTRTFGGFTKVSWDESNEYKIDASAFVFNFYKEKIFAVVDPAHAIYCASTGPVFGKNNTLRFYESFKSSNDSYPGDYAKSYNIPKTSGDYSYLTRERANFALDEFECYSASLFLLSIVN